MPESLDAVYAPFVASLRAGGLGPPPEGEWPAELVAAHIARNNDLIAEAAEQIAAGHEVRYDNAAGVDDAELAEMPPASADCRAWPARSSVPPRGWRRPGTHWATGPGHLCT